MIIDRHLKSALQNWHSQLSIERLKYQSTSLYCSVRSILCSLDYGTSNIRYIVAVTNMLWVKGCALHIEEEQRASSRYYIHGYIY